MVPFADGTKINSRAQQQRAWDELCGYFYGAVVAVTRYIQTHVCCTAGVSTMRCYDYQQYCMLRIV